MYGVREGGRWLGKLIIGSEGGVIGASHVTCSKKHAVNNVSMRGVQNLFLQHGGVCGTSMRIAG